jgi:hypothetical protein
MRPEPISPLAGREDERSRHLSCSGQDALRRRPARHVDVVPAGVHDANVAAILIADPHLLAYGTPVFSVIGRASISVRTMTSGRAVLEDADDSRIADFGRPRSRVVLVPSRAGPPLLF